MKKRNIVALLLIALLLLSMLAGCGASKGVTIGSKQFTESILLGEMYAQLIEAKTDIPVTRKLNLGGVSVCMPAMEKGEIDMYFEYTGTAYNEILDHTFQQGTTPEEVLKVCQEEMARDHGITMFDPLGLNNTYDVAIRSDRARELGVSKISDLSSIAGNLNFGCGHSFYSRAHDGYSGMVETYNLNFKDTKLMDTSLLYESIETGALDVIIVFGTDSLLKKYDMILLEDDKAFFPPYHGAPMCRNETLTKYPELSDVLNSLAGKIDSDTMQELNYQVDVENRSVEDVAKEFLTSRGFIAPDNDDNAKLYTEQVVLDIALKDAGIYSSEASEIEVELKTQNSVKVYEVEFNFEEFEYDYVIHAETGEIISKTCEKEGQN